MMIDMTRAEPHEEDDDEQPDEDGEYSIVSIWLFLNLFYKTSHFLISRPRNRSWNMSRGRCMWNASSGVPLETLG